MNKTGKTGAHPVRYMVTRLTHGEWGWGMLAPNGRPIFVRDVIFPTANKCLHDINRFEEMVRSKPVCEVEG